MPRLGLARKRARIDRFDPHDLQQPTHPFAIDHLSLPTQQLPQPSTPVNRVLQMQLVEPSHQGQILRRLRTGVVVVPAARESQQLALLANAQLLA